MSEWSSEIERDLAKAILATEDAMAKTILAAEQVQSSYRQKLKKKNAQTVMLHQSGLNPRVKPNETHSGVSIEWRHYTPIQLEDGTWKAVSEHIKKAGKYRYRADTLKRYSKPWLFALTLDTEAQFAKFRKTMRELRTIRSQLWATSDTLGIRSAVEFHAGKGKDTTESEDD